MTTNQKVEGSSPSGRAKIYSDKGGYEMRIAIYQYDNPQIIFIEKNKYFSNSGFNYPSDVIELDSDWRIFTLKRCCFPTVVYCRRPHVTN